MKTALCIFLCLLAVPTSSQCRLDDDMEFTGPRLPKYSFGIDGTWTEEFECYSLGADGPRRGNGYFEFTQSEDEFLFCMVELPANIDPNQFILVEMDLIKVIPLKRSGVFDAVLDASNSGGLWINPHELGVYTDSYSDVLQFHLDLWGRNGYQGYRRPLIIRRDVLHHEDMAEKIRLGEVVRITAKLF